MDSRSLMTRVAAALAAFMLSGAIGHAAEVKVLTSVALKTVLAELAPVFEKKTGDKLVIDYGLAAAPKKRIDDGERADVIIVTRAMMEDLVKQKKVADGIVNVAAPPSPLPRAPAQRSRISARSKPSNRRFSRPSLSSIRTRRRVACPACSPPAPSSVSASPSK